MDGDGFAGTSLKLDAAGHTARPDIAGHQALRRLGTLGSSALTNGLTGPTKERPEIDAARIEERHNLGEHASRGAPDLVPFVQVEADPARRAVKIPGLLKNGARVQQQRKRHLDDLGHFLWRRVKRRTLWRVRYERR